MWLIKYVDTTKATRMSEKSPLLSLVWFYLLLKLIFQE